MKTPLSASQRFSVSAFSPALPRASRASSPAGVWVEQRGAGGSHPPAPDYSKWTPKALVRELNRLNHRQTFTIVSAKVRREEDAQIDAIIAEQRRREAR